MIVVIADDLSGAAEMAGVAARQGFAAEVQTAFAADTRAEVLCLTTDSRSLSSDEAACAVREVAQRITEAKPEWIFKKCDSVLRGHVLAEARALATIAGYSEILIVSANPSRGRTVVGGRYLVAGQPLHETVFARDPEHPRQTAVVAELLNGDLTGVRVPDVASSDDIERQVAALNRNTLPVGGADFFEALLLSREKPARDSHSTLEGAVQSQAATLVVCGSAASWSQREKEAIAARIPVVAAPYDLSAAGQALRKRGGLLIGVGQGAATLGRAPAELVAELAGKVAHLLQSERVDQLLLEGGATASAVVRVMGWRQLPVTAVTDTGLAVLRLAGSDLPRVLIKPGSYSWPLAVWPSAGGLG
jgi:uncharacterized protein YgbK (DUF1537 family)